MCFYWFPLNIRGRVGEAGKGVGGGVGRGIYFVDGKGRGGAEWEGWDSTTLPYHTQPPIYHINHYLPPSHQLHTKHVCHIITHLLNNQTSYYMMYFHHIHNSYILELNR